NDAHILPAAIRHAGPTALALARVCKLRRAGDARADRSARADIRSPRRQRLAATRSLRSGALQPAPALPSPNSASRLTQSSFSSRQWAISSDAGIITAMDDFRKMARDPKHRRSFEKLLYLAAQRGDGDLVAERLSWGIDPNCTSAKGRTPLIANVGGFCPNVETVKALLAAGADPGHMDEAGLTALDYARRKLMKIQARPRRRPRKSPSL